MHLILELTETEDSGESGIYSVGQLEQRLNVYRQLQNLTLAYIRQHPDARYQQIGCDMV